MSTHSLTERYLAEDVYEDVALPDWIRLKMYPGMDAEPCFAELIHLLRS